MLENAKPCKTFTDKLVYDTLEPHNTSHPDVYTHTHTLSLPPLLSALYSLLSALYSPFSPPFPLLSPFCVSLCV